MNPVALLEPDKGDNVAAPAPVAKPPGAGASVALATLGVRELYCAFAPACAKAEVCKAVVKSMLPDAGSIVTLPNESVTDTEMLARADWLAEKKRLNPTTDARQYERNVFIVFSR
jgi:hypothetical protein